MTEEDIRKASEYIDTYYHFKDLADCCRRVADDIEKEHARQNRHECLVYINESQVHAKVYGTRLADFLRSHAEDYDMESERYKKMLDEL